MNNAGCTHGQQSLQDQMLMRCNRILSDAEFLSAYAVSVAHIESENIRLTADNEVLKKIVLAFAAEQDVPPDSTEWASARRDAARYRFLRSHCQFLTITSQPFGEPGFVDSSVDLGIRDIKK